MKTFRLAAIALAPLLLVHAARADGYQSLSELGSCEKFVAQPAVAGISLAVLHFEPRFVRYPTILGDAGNKTATVLLPLGLATTLLGVATSGVSDEQKCIEKTVAQLTSAKRAEAEKSSSVSHVNLKDIMPYAPEPTLPEAPAAPSSAARAQE